ncbi:hypothetical protein DMH20_10940 [Escherichia coli]|nr:hypothetical protein [Escherichia coli]
MADGPYVGVNASF